MWGQSHVIGPEGIGDISPLPPKRQKCALFRICMECYIFRKHLVRGPQIWCLGICLAIFWWTMFRRLQCIIYFFVQGHLAASRPSSGRRNMQWWPKQIQIASPNLIVSASGSEIENPIEMKYEKQSKQIQFSSSPNLIVKKKHSQAFSEFSGTLWQS